MYGLKKGSPNDAALHFFCTGDWIDGDAAFILDQELWITAHNPVPFFLPDKGNACRSGLGITLIALHLMRVAPHELHHMVLE